MGKLTASQVAAKVDVSVYTLKRWYKWYESLSAEEFEKHILNKMPKLPDYLTIGTTAWRYWDEEDIPQIKKFKEWVPNTRAGVMGSLNKKDK